MPGYSGTKELRGYKGMRVKEIIVSEETVLCAFDYAINQKTFVVGGVVRDISQNVSVLSQNTRQSMIRKIDELRKQDGLGHHQDAAQWEGLCSELVRAELEAQR